MKNRFVFVLRYNPKSSNFKSSQIIRNHHPTFHEIHKNLR
jgi:hypothetical protein